MRGGSIRIEGFTTFTKPIEIDLDDLGPGVIAITGANGSGKTSLAESLGPGCLYRRFPSRAKRDNKIPTLLPNWVGPEGGSIIRKFHHGEKTYHADVRVSKGGDQSAILRVEGEATPLASGKVKEYDAEILKLFGPEAAFLAGAFAAQGGTGRFNDLDDATRKSIFRYYLDLDRVAVLQKLTDNRIKTIDLSTHDRVVAEIKCLDDELLPAARKLADEKKDEVDRWDEALAEARKGYASVSDQAAIVDLVAAYRDACQRAIEAREAVGPAPATITANLDDLREDQQNASDDVAKIDRLRLDLERCDRALNDAQREHSRACTVRDMIETVPCAGKGVYAKCRFLVDANRAAEAIPGLRLSEETAHAAKDKVLAALPSDRDQMIARAKLAESELAIREATDSFRAVEAWKSRQARAKDLIRSAFDLKKKLPEEIPDDLPTHEEVDAYRVRVANAETSHRIRLGEEASLKAEVKRLETRRAELVAEARKTSGLRDEFDATKALAWALREVQIAEIDLAGPMIADTANDLLRSCYGTRFQIRIKTQSEKKTGGIKDDFDVEVWDERIGKAQSIDGVSGGEQVVIDEVLRNALALFARKRSGCPVETLWRDEVFASLYPPNDQLYVQMLHRVRNLGGFYQIFYVASEDMARSADAEIHLVGDGTVQIRR